MYNQDIKERYLATRVSSVYNEYRNYFEVSSKLEEIVSKDVACFSIAEIDAFLSNYGFCEPDTVKNRIAKLSSYTTWYSENIQACTNNYKRYDVSRFPYAEMLKPTLLYSANELSNRILQVYDAYSGQPAMAALMLAWLGIDSADSVTLKKEQVDTRNGKIYDSTGAIIVHQMPDVIRERLDIYSKTYSAIRVQNQTFTVYAEDIGYFIKRMKTANSGKKSGPYSNRQMVGYIRELHDKYAEMFGKEAATPLNYTNVQRSGNFYRLHQLDLAGVDVHDIKNADKVRMCLGKSKRYHKDNMIMYDAYLECIGEK